MKLALEVTSVLETLFLISLLEKKFTSQAHLEIHLLILNNHVNDGTVEFAVKAFTNYSYTFKIYDYRGEKNFFISENKNNYECLVVRSRLQLASHNFFSYSKSYFRTTGNCNNSKKVQLSFAYKDLYLIEDGLSNWKTRNARNLYHLFWYTCLFLKYRKTIAIPLVMRNILPKTNYVKHFSIFSELEESSIQYEFSNVIQTLSLIYEMNYEIEELFIGIWPEFEGERTCQTNLDIQIKVFSDYIRNKYPNYRDKTFFVKEHPKWKLDFTLSPDVKFVRLADVYCQAPLELVINRFPNLHSIYGFPSTCFYLMGGILAENVDVSIFVKEGDVKYFPERAALIESKNPKINKIYV